MMMVAGSKRDGIGLGKVARIVALIDGAGGMELQISVVQTLIDDDKVGDPRLGIVDLALSHSEPRFQALGRLGASGFESGLELLDRGRADEDDERTEAGMVLQNQLDSLGINIQDASLLLMLRHLRNRLQRCPIAIAPEFSMLDEFAVFDHFLELVSSDEMVSHPIRFAFSRLSSGMGDGEAKLGPVLAGL